MASYQYVYVMKDLTKAFPGGREVFKGITLSFLPGVKIGVLGVNGAGKSTLMKIMAGIDTEFGGEAWAAAGVTVGYLQQEPNLDPTKTVGENVEEAFAELKAALDRYNEISNKFAEPMSDDEMNACWPSKPTCRTRSTRRTAGNSTARWTSRWTRCAARRPTPKSTKFPAASGGVSRCASCCWKSPTCCCWTNQPTIWTPKAWRGWRRP